MASQDTYFKVKTGLGVGTEALYADATTKSVAIGATTAKYTLDVYGDIYGDANVLVDNNIGIGTTIPVQRLDVRGVGIFSGSVGVGTTNPEQRFQVNSSNESPVVITDLGLFGVNTLTPTQPFQVVGSEPGEVVVITGFSSIGIRTESPQYDFHYITTSRDYTIIINKDGYIGIEQLEPDFNVDINGDLRVTGLATITNAYVGVATVGFATITNSYIGVATIGFATITNAYVGVATVGFATITNEFVGVSTVGLASITNAYVGVATVGLATITNEFVGVSTVGLASITNEFVGVSTVGLASITNEFVGVSTVGFATITDAYIGVATVGLATITNAYVGVATVGFATITNEFVGVSTVGLASITNAYVGVATVGFATITDAYVGVATVGFATIRNSFLGITTVGLASITNEFVGVSTVGFATITNAYIGVATVGFATITNEVVGVSTIGIASITREKVLDSEIENLLVTGITTTAKLDVGIGATLIRARSFGITTVTDLDGDLIKQIHPIVGIGTTLPTRTLDVSGDLRVRGEVIDANNQVGYAYSVLASAGSIGITGRFFDGANLLIRNKEFIAEEIVGFLTSTDGPFGIYGENFDYGPVGVTTGREKCKRDIGLIIDAIAFDITKGGNSKSVGAGVSYSQGNYLESSSPAPAGLSGYPGGYVKFATLTGISSISSLARYVINNVPLPKSYQSGINSVSQYIDLEISADGDSNQNLLGCANVQSAIHSAVGIVTTIINAGSLQASGIKLNDPSGQLVWQPPGPRIGNEWFVNKLGDDRNGGTGPGDAFLTIKKAASIAQPGDTIKVFAGLYIEDGPISLNERVAIVGEDLRRTLVTTRDKTDLFYVKRGCYVAGMSFVGESNPGKAMVSFPTQGYGYADGTEENWQSPYVQNCTNFVPDSIGMRIDGNRAGGFKSMVLDAYTQYNQGGIGVSITNFGYAQLVSLFTICCHIAVFCDTGGVCDLNNSNSSFGDIGLWSNGSTPLQYTGTVESVVGTENIDRLIVNVGTGASSEFIDSVKMLRANKDYIASEVVGFITSTSSNQIFPGVVAPFPGIGNSFDYGGSTKGREFCRRDSKIIIEQICSDILTLGNKNSIDAGLAYRDTPDGSLSYLDETTPPPVGFSTGYVKDAEIAAIKFIAGISTYIVRNRPVPFTFQSGIGTFSQVFLSGITTSALVDNFISSRAGIITSIIGIGTQAAPEIILPKGQRPYDGQIAVIGEQYYFVSSIKITNPGSNYSPDTPIEVRISDPPDTRYFITAEAIIPDGTVGAGGTITEIQILSSGTGYDINNPPTVTIDPPALGGTQATAEVVLEKLFFNPIQSTQVSAGGTTIVTFDEFIDYPVSVGTTVYFYQSSKIIASSITFEYVGTGINIVNAIPSKGAVPIDENQIVATNGGKVPFTSTDQSGDFRISEGITINQNTGTISGQAFSKSLQAEVTPLIIALQ